MSTTEILSTFHVGDFYCGIYTKEVVELNKDLEVTSVPLVSRSVLGLLNLRGQIVTAIDMRERLNCVHCAPATESVGIFYKHAGDFYAFIVDRVSEIIEMNQTDFESSSDHFTGPEGNFALGVYKMPGRLLLVLDAEKLVSGMTAN